MMSILDWHDCESSDNTKSGKASKNQPFIRALQLETSASFDVLVNFYHGKIGFPIIEKSNRFVTFAAGMTQITFQKTKDPKSQPFYHFAFNIPQNKILKARNWQIQRSGLIPTPNHMLDPNFPNDIRHFRNWNAHSIFFWDPAGNLLEYIARHDLGNTKKGPFSTSDILYASEIALIVDDVNREAKQISNALKIQQYLAGSEKFRAMGDENGLLLLMKKGRVWAWHTDQAKSTNIFSTQVKTFDSSHSYAFDNLPYQVN